MGSGEKRRILVTGATGAQGGSVAHHLLSRGQFAVRALTRHPEQDKADALRQAGAEVVRGDLDDASSLRSALEGCYGCYGVTNFWEHFEHERDQGRNLVDAVATSGVQHFVFSTLPHVKKATNGELSVPHFDIKAELEDYTRERQIPATFVHLAFYYENLLAFFPPRRQEDGTYGFGFPQGDTPLAAVSVEDIGGVVAVIFERREEFLGKAVYIAGDERPAAEYAEIMTRVLGRKVTYNHIPREVFASFGFPGAEDLADMFEFYRTRVPRRQADIEQSHAIFPGMKSFEGWVRLSQEKFQPVFQS